MNDHGPKMLKRGSDLRKFCRLRNFSQNFQFWMILLTLDSLHLQLLFNLYLGHLSTLGLEQLVAQSRCAMGSAGRRPEEI